jgi:hypothetical protein
MLWRRCSCGLPTPCVDRLLPASLPPFPPRARSRGSAPTALRPHPRTTPARSSPGAPQFRRATSAPAPVPLPQKRRPSPPQPIPAQERRATKDRLPLSLRHSAPGGSRAQSAGSGGPSVSLSPRPPGGDGTPMRKPPPPGSHLRRQRRRPAPHRKVAPPSPDGLHDRGSRISVQAHGRPGPSPGRPAMADRQINLHHW